MTKTMDTPKKNMNTQTKDVKKEAVPAAVPAVPTAAAVSREASRVIAKEVISATLPESEMGYTLSAFARYLQEEGISMEKEALTAWLRKEGYLRRRVNAAWNTPTLASYDRGLMALYRVLIVRGGAEEVLCRFTTITEKGAAYFLGLLREGK